MEKFAIFFALLLLASQANVGQAGPVTFGFCYYLCNTALIACAGVK